jgi:hypothetical protein
MPRSTVLFAMTAALLLQGCAARSPLPALSLSHPANPDAAEAPAPACSGTLSAAEPVSIPAQAGLARHGEMHTEHGSGALPVSWPATQAVAYTCPMHPEIVSDAPGKCPKCGMSLVPKSQEQSEHGDQQ